MRPIGMIVADLCLTAGQVRSQTSTESFEEQVAQGIRKISSDATSARQALAASKLQGGVTGRAPGLLDPADALDKTKVGIAAKFVSIKPGVFKMGSGPDERVSWIDAQRFIEKLNKIQNEYAYRLPTEAEWEYAARGGMPSSFPYFFGFNETNEIKNHSGFDGNSGLSTHAVNAPGKMANQYGFRSGPRYTRRIAQ